MNGRCRDREEIRLLLTATLSGAVERDLSEHVAECPECRGQLESLAAEGSWWNEAYQRLNRGYTEELALRSTSGANDDDLQFATDFAVDFLEPSDDPQMLGRLEEYEIVDVIGRGGMGIVVKGFQKELQRYVAVKVLSPHLATSAAARRRFAREAQATAAVVHPHVMAIHSVQAQAKLPYLVMPYVACESLQQRLDICGFFELKDVLRIGMQTALGLAAAHAQGLVHRDVKPANILLETNVDRVVLTDFGLARAVDDASLTRTGIIAGTPQYMSPEQANGDGVDPRSDLFSLGGVLYAMCTGRPPFRAETTFGILRRIRETPPRPIREINSDVPDWFEKIVLKLLEKQAQDRFATARQVASLLEQCLAHVQNPLMANLPVEVLDLLQCHRGKSQTDVGPTSMRSKIMRTLLGIGAVAVGMALLLMYFLRLQLAPLKSDPLENLSSAVSPEHVPVEISPREIAQEVHDSSDAPRYPWNSVSEELDRLTKTIEELESASLSQQTAVQNEQAPISKDSQ